jgi:hypothetical protein
MKIVQLTVIVVALCLLATAQTQDLGQNVFYSDEGPINIALDATVASYHIDSPYVMFVLYMGTDKDMSALIDREDVIMIHNDVEYTMTSFDELRKEYDKDRRDYNLYMQTQKQSLITSQMRFYTFQWNLDFFPARFERVTRADQGGISSTVGFRTKAYFKNPGFKSGDQVLIKVIDKKKPDMWGAVSAVL